MISHLFRWLKDFAEYPPYACMADAALSTSNALKEIFPDCVRLVCYWHVGKQLRDKIQRVRALDRDMADSIYHDVNKLQLHALDESSFNVLLKLFLKKWTTKCPFTDESDELKDAVKQFLSYFQSQWIEKEGIQKG